MKVKIESNIYSLPDIEIVLCKRDLGRLVSEGKLNESLNYWEKPEEDGMPTFNDNGKRTQKFSITVEKEGE